MQTDNIVEYIKTNHPELPDLIAAFPEHDHWTLRRLRRDVLKDVVIQSIPRNEVLDSAPIKNLTPAAQTALRAGFFRPISVQLQDRPPVAPIFEKAGDTYLVICDLHAPDIDPDAYDVAIQVGQALPLSGIIINGDGMDVHALSRFVPAADKPYRFVDEREEAVKTFATLREAFPETKVVYLFGNHDKRPETYLSRVAPQFQGLFSLEQILGLDSFGFEFVDGRYVVPGTELLVKHGTTVRKHSGYTVHGEMAAARMSLILGHVHRLSMVSSRGIVHEVKGEQPFIGVEGGCLCSLTPSYIEPENTADWQHGAIVVTVFDEGLFSVEPVVIHNGVAMFRGHRFVSRVRNNE